MNTKFIDNDCRNEPKTTRFCIRCQKDIKPGQPARMVHITDHCLAIHPSEEPIAEVSEGDGWWLVGMECARRIGMEWTHDVDESKIAATYAPFQEAIGTQGTNTYGEV